MTLELHNYSNTSEIPVKLVASGCVRNGRIPPMHPSLYPTNACPLNCPFCNTKHLDRNVSWSEKDAAEIPPMLAALGTRAASLSGGGEPLAFRHLETLVGSLAKGGIECGVVTNGRLIDRLSPRVIGRLTWVRISIHAHNRFSSLPAKILDMVLRERGIAWSFRYVYQGDDDVPDLTAAAQFAAKHGLPVYASGELFSGKGPDPSQEVFRRFGNLVAENKMDKAEDGAGECWHGLLKPLIAADGFVYPCCLVGFPDRILDRRFVLCHWRDLGTYIESQKPFDGSGCRGCTYGNYNRYLGCFKKKLVHPNFV